MGDQADLLYFVFRVGLAVTLLLFLVVAALMIQRDLTRSSEPANLAQDMQELHLYVLEPGASGYSRGEMILVKRRAKVGRAAESDVRLDDPSVSMNHARLERSKGTWLLRDLQSTNGTFIEAAPVMEPTAVACGDSLAFGRVRMRVVC